MTAITKAELARRFGVNKAQATRWADAGMPVLPGGLVDDVAATRWVELNVDTNVRDARQRRVYGHVSPAMRERSDAMDELMRLAVRLTVWRTPSFLSTLAAEAGLSDEQAGRLHDLVETRHEVLEGDVAQLMGLPKVRPVADPLDEGELPPGWA